MRRFPFLSEASWETVTFCIYLFIFIYFYPHKVFSHQLLGVSRGVMDGNGHVKQCSYPGGILHSAITLWKRMNPSIFLQTNRRRSWRNVYRLMGIDLFTGVQIFDVALIHF